MRNKLVIYLFKLLVVFTLLWGTHAWFTWHFNNVTLVILYLIIIVISYSYKRCEHIELKFNNRILFAYILYIFNEYYINQGSIGTALKLFGILYLSTIILSDRKNIDETIDFTLKSIALILLPGMVLHIILLVVGILPVPVIEHPGNSVYKFFNYWILLRGSALYEAEGIRFQSIFLEAGYTGTMLAFLLYLGRFNFKKKENIVILIGLLLTLSLAGYLIAIIGYFIYLRSQNVNILQQVKYLFLLLLVCFVSTQYNDGHNIINEKILERLKFDEKKGIKGNNRTGETADYYYERFLQTGDLWTGIGHSNLKRINDSNADESNFNTQIRGAGYKIYFITNGIITAIFYLMFYYFLGPCSFKRRHLYMNGFLILIIITFIGSAYPSSFSWIIPYLLGTRKHNNNIENEYRNINVPSCT